jgi:hypothetical protein
MLLQFASAQQQQQQQHAQLSERSKRVKFDEKKFDSLCLKV